jgi:TPR repeat protein
LKYAAVLADGRGVKKDLATAREILDKLCAAGIQPGCEMAKRIPKS